MPQLKDSYFDCPTCGKREHLDNVPQCQMCHKRVCPNCSSELAWDLEACPEHLSAVVHGIERERDELRNLAKLNKARVVDWMIVKGVSLGW